MICQKALQKIIQVHIVSTNYQLKKRCFLVKGYAACMSNIHISRQKSILKTKGLQKIVAWLGAVQRGWLDLLMNDAMSSYLYYIAMSCNRSGQQWTPRVSLCPVLLSAHWAWPRASALQVVWRAGTYMACTLGGTHEGPIKLDRAFDLKGNFWEMQKMTPKNQITLEIFRMLKCNDFLMYSSYTTKMYMKNMGGSARNSVVEKQAFFEVQGSPLGGHFFEG